MHENAVNMINYSLSFAAACVDLLKAFEKSFLDLLFYKNLYLTFRELLGTVREFCSYSLTLSVQVTCK